MWEAVVFGVLACSSLVVGGVVGSYWEAPERVTGVILAFASGTMLLWLATAVLLVPAVPIGRVLLSGADPGTLAFPLSFAGGRCWPPWPTRSCRRRSSAAGRSTPSRPAPGSSWPSSWPTCSRGPLLAVAGP